MVQLLGARGVVTCCPARTEAVRSRRSTVFPPRQHTFRSVNIPRQGPPPSFTQGSRHRWVKVVASLVVAASFVWWFRRAGLPLVPSAQEWARLPLGVWSTNFGLVLLAHLIRCNRWVHLLRPLAPSLDRFHTIGVGLLGYLAALAAPFRIGEFVRPLLIARTRAVGFFEALGSIVAERVVDGLTITLLGAAALMVTPPLSELPDRLGEVPLPVQAAPRVIMLGPLVFGGVLLAMCVLWLGRSVVLAVVPRVLGRISENLASMVTSLVARLAEGFGALRDGFGVAFAIDNLLYWCTLILAHWVLLDGLGFAATLAQAGVIVGLQALGSLLPAGPGQFGAFQLSGYVGLVLYFPTNQVLTSGALVVFISYASQIFAHILGAGLGLWLVRRQATVAVSP